MTFYLTPLGEVAYGAPPEGATVIDPKDPRPFAGRVVLATALAALIRLNAAWYRTRWSITPQGTRAVLTDAVLTGAVLTDAVLTGAVLTRADLTGAVLTRAVLTGADLTDADLTDAVLTGAVLTDAVLTRADLTGADLTRAVLTGAVLRGAVVRGADLRVAVGIATPEEEAASLAGAIDAIAADPSLWRQDLWHGEGYDPSEAPTVGACGTAHCLAGHLQAQLPLGHPYRSLEASDAGTRLAPRAAAAGWFGATVHPDLQARVDAAVAARQ